MRTGKNCNSGRFTSSSDSCSFQLEECQLKPISLHSEEFTHRLGGGYRKELIHGNYSDSNG